MAQAESYVDQQVRAASSEETALRKRFERVKAKLRKLAEAEGLLRRD